MISEPGKANTVGTKIFQNYRKRQKGKKFTSTITTINNGEAIEYGETIIEGQIIAIVNGKAYNPSVVYANGKPGIGIATMSGDAGTIGYYKTSNQVISEIGTEGELYLSPSAPYYSNTQQTANGAICQIVGRRVNNNIVLLQCEPPTEIDYEPI